MLSAMSTDTPLSPRLVERVLERLGFASRPETNLRGLTDLYGAWCQRVPSDNVQKLIHLRSHAPGPLPGDDAGAVLEAWLEHGTGSTCWGASSAMHELLEALGFRAHRVLSTIVFTPDLAPNHGTTIAEVDDEFFLVDTSLLHGEPLLLSQERETAIEHAAWALPARFEEGQFWFDVSPLLTTGSLPTRMDLIGASEEQVRERNEATRDWGPFNYALSVRTNRGAGVIGTAWMKRIEIDAEGERTEHAFDRSERARWLIEEIGLSEEIVETLPADLPTPSPPGVATDAQDRGSA